MDSAHDFDQQEKKKWLSKSAVTRFEWMQHYHKKRCTAETAAQKLGISVQTFMKYAPNYIDMDNRMRAPFEKKKPTNSGRPPNEKRKPDLKTYKRVVVYIKESEPAYPGEPKILITENNLTKSVIQVNVLDATQAADTESDEDDELPLPSLRFRKSTLSPRKRALPLILNDDDFDIPAAPGRDGDEFDPPQLRTVDDPDYQDEPPVKSPKKKLNMSLNRSWNKKKPTPVRTARDEPVTQPDGKLRIPTMHLTGGVRDFQSNLHLIKRILGQDYLLSSKMSRTVVPIRDEKEPIYRRMQRSRITIDGEEIFACADCKGLRRQNKNERNFRIPTINLNTGEYNHLEHICPGLSLVKVIAVEIDRCNRLILTSGTESDKKKVWEMGRLRALEISEEFGFPKTGKESIMEQYPEYDKVSSAYNRLYSR